MARKHAVIQQRTSSLPSSFFKKSHKLVFSQLSLSPIEHDIFALFLSRLGQDKWTDYIDEETHQVLKVPEYTFKNELLAEWFNVKSRDLYSILKKPSLRMNSLSVGIIDDVNKTFIFRNIFPNISYQNAQLKIEPNHSLLAEFFCLSQGHAQVPHKEFRELKTEYAKRIFTILCRFKKSDQKLHPIKLHDLHGYLGLLDNQGRLVKKSYERVSNLTTKIINPAIAEIERVMKGTLKFIVDGDKKGYSTILENRKIVAIEFLFEWQEKGQITQNDQDKITVSDSNYVDTYMKILKSKDLDTITQEDIQELKNNWFDLDFDADEMNYVRALMMANFK